MRFFEIKDIKIPLAILATVWLPVLFVHRYYMDDLGRSVRGYYEWSPNGRPLAEAIFQVFNLGGKVVDYSPIYQILALIIMSISCVMLLRSLDIKMTTLNLSASSLVFLSPLYIENFSYIYDSLSMAISCLLAIASFNLSKEPKDKIGFLFGIILGVFYLSTYQAFMSVYIALSIAYAMRSVSVKKSLSSLFPLIISIAIYYLIYSILIAPNFIEGNYNKIHSEVTKSPDVIVYNFKTLYAFLVSYMSGIAGSLFFILALLSAAIYILMNYLKNSFMLSSWKGLLAFALLLSPLIIYLPLKSPVYYPRVFVGLGAVLSILVIYASEFILKNKVVMYAIGLYSFSMLILSTSYLNASNALYNYESYEITRILSSINDEEGKKVVVFGSLEKPPITRNIAERNKIIDYMTPIYLNGSSWWGKLQLNMYGMDRNYVTDKAERDSLEAKICDKGLIRKGIYKTDSYIILVLSNVSCL